MSDTYRCCYCGGVFDDEEIVFVGEAYDLSEVDPACLPCAKQWGWEDDA